MYYAAALVLAISICGTRGEGTMPDRNDAPAMARFVVNQANWTTLAHISKDSSGNPAPNNILLALSDGKLGCGSGVPYFWTTKMHSSVNQLLQGDTRGAIAVTLAQTPICLSRGWDPQFPLCAHVVLHGSFSRLEKKDEEFRVAMNALFVRHPQFAYYPAGHSFFPAKFNIDKISMISNFGGSVNVNVEEYFKIKC